MKSDSSCTNHAFVEDALAALQRWPVWKCPQRRLRVAVEEFADSAQAAAGGVACDTTRCDHHPFAHRNPAAAVDDGRALGGEPHTRRPVNRPGKLFRGAKGGADVLVRRPDLVVFFGEFPGDASPPVQHVGCGMRDHARFRSLVAQAVAVNDGVVGVGEQPIVDGARRFGLDFLDRRLQLVARIRRHRQNRYLGALLIREKLAQLT